MPVQPKPKPPRWWAPKLERSELQELMRRTNGQAFYSYGLWLALLAATGYLAARLFPSPWSIPAFLLYGSVYGMCNPRWHESLHGTPFRTGWLNKVMYFVTAAMDFRDVVFARRSHLNHHAYTILTDYDLEILPRPFRLWKLALEFFGLFSGPIFMGAMVLHALGIPTKMSRRVVPEAELPAMFWAARGALLLWLIPIALSIALRSWLPVLLFGLPRLYGGVLIWLFVLTQHAGLEANVTDHRRVCRTIRLNPVFSFLYMHMENHTEHHVFPNVPFHALPRLHARIGSALPVTYRGLWHAWREMVPALIRMRRDPSYFIRRELPPG